MNEVNQIIGMVPGIFRALPTILAYVVIAKLTHAHVKGWNGPISSTDAAYTLIGLAAFAYAIR